ncbi:hypothetical protein [Polaromonas sp.]|uniref:hypothetical protein n=1 Tax=Polaromonas sp. TaxID=1869339 RepID=UPI00352A9149
MLTKGQKHEERSLLSAAKICYLVSLVSLAMFAYSFFVWGPSHGAMNSYSRPVEEAHFTFVTEGRWYFLIWAFALLAMGLKSVSKANRLHRPIGKPL